MYSLYSPLKIWTNRKSISLLAAMTLKFEKSLTIHLKLKISYMFLFAYWCLLACKYSFNISLLSFYFTLQKDRSLLPKLVTHIYQGCRGREPIPLAGYDWSYPHIKSKWHKNHSRQPDKWGWGEIAYTQNIVNVLKLDLHLTSPPILITLDFSLKSLLQPWIALGPLGFSKCVWPSYIISTTATHRVSPAA